MTAPTSTPEPPAPIPRLLRTIANLLNSSPVTWDDTSDVKDKIILVSESFELLAQLRERGLQQEFGRKQSLGKVMFSWLKYLLTNPDLEKKPAKLKLSVFHDPLYANTPIEIPILGGTAYLTQPQDHDLDSPKPSTADATRKTRVDNANINDGGGDLGGEDGAEGVEDDDVGDEEDKDGLEDGGGEAPSWDARQVQDSDYRDSDDAESDEDERPAKKKKPAEGKKAASSSSKKRPRVDADADGQTSKKIKAIDSKKPDGAYSPATPCDNCAARSTLCWAHKANVACNPCTRKRQQCSLSVRSRNRLNAAQLAKDAPSKGVQEARIISNNSLAVDEDRDDLSAKTSTRSGLGLPSRATSVASSVSYSTAPGQSTAMSVSAYTADLSKKPLVESRALSKKVAASAPAKVVNANTARLAQPSEPEKSAKTSQGETTTSKTPKSDEPTCPLSAVHPAAPVEFTWSTVERTVTSLILQNASQQAAINQLSATVAVLLEDSKDYEKIASDAVGHHDRIGELETQLHLARQENKLLREDAMKWNKAVNTTVEGHGRQLEGITGILNIVNNWTAYQMKRELGETVSTSSVSAILTHPGPTPVPTSHCPTSNTHSQNHVPAPDDLSAILELFTRAEAFATQAGPGQAGPTTDASASQGRNGINPEERTKEVSAPQASTSQASISQVNQAEVSPQANPSSVQAPSSAHTSEDHTSIEDGSPHCFLDSIEDIESNVDFQEWRYEYDEVEDLLLYVDSDSS